MISNSCFIFCSGLWMPNFSATIVLSPFPPPGCAGCKHHPFKRAATQFPHKPVEVPTGVEATIRERHGFKGRSHGR